MIRPYRITNKMILPCTCSGSQGYELTSKHGDPLAKDEFFDLPLLVVLAYAIGVVSGAHQHLQAVTPNCVPAWPPSAPSPNKMRVVENTAHPDVFLPASPSLASNLTPVVRSLKRGSPSDPTTTHLSHRRNPVNSTTMHARTESPATRDKSNVILGANCCARLGG